MVNKSGAELGSVAGPAIQANESVTFEDDLRSGIKISGCDMERRGPRGRSKSGDIIDGCPYSVLLATAVTHYNVGTLLTATIAAAPPPRRRRGWRGLFNLGIFM